MATTAVPETANKPTFRSDDIFFLLMALLILAIVVTGFAQSYFFAGMIRAKLPSVVVHVHGALFVTWIFLLVAQSSLIASRKVKLHMSLGILGFILPPLMVVAGILTLFGAVRRGIEDIPPEILLAGDLENLVIFIVLISWGMLARRNSAFHKRLMILGTMAITGPAIDRWGFGLPVTIGVIMALPIVVLAYDLCSLRRVHRSTAVGTAMIVTAMLTILPFSKMGFWHQLVSWIQHN
jgi:hypothetical protein